MLMNSVFGALYSGCSICSQVGYTPNAMGGALKDGSESDAYGTVTAMTCEFAGVCSDMNMK